MTDKQDTIFALSSAYGKAGVSVFRISGPRAMHILERMSGAKKIISHKMFLANLRHPKTGELIDRAMAAFMKAPKSYTGEDTAELFTHGSVAVTDALYGALASFKDARLAEPGEFTKRAFLNGKLDLTQVEAVADLIEAQTESQRRLALSTADGKLANLYGKWRAELVKILSHTEAAIDFSDDEMPENIAADTARQTKSLISEMQAHIATAASARMIRGGINVAIIGRPNAGKSSLFNKIIGEARAIVSSAPGTTRDVIEASLDVMGFKTNLFDTAGLNEKSDDPIEKKGMKKAREKAESADLRILISDRPSELAKHRADADTIIVLNKIDRKKSAEIPAGIIAISVKTGENFEKFRAAFEDAIRKKMSVPNDMSLTRQRYKNALAECVENLERSLSAPSADLKAEHVREAANAIASITGEVYFSELLDEIFSHFCLGK
ncbi:MAG: tRNA uridine-5-carboxymethylaminomethyl(34) synthesis GTPase MnmE [Rickettsiales bacterium]|nr:tRNA uridine-5-carboxymethylaminomethyl(34) synthesis GTPase MnmE [Rickettsiales bacterium]